MAKYTIKDIYARRDKFSGMDELKDRIDTYFDMCDCVGVSVTYTGLMLALGLSDKSQLSSLRYDSDYGDIVKGAISAVEFFYETKLSEGKPVGAIFALKNFGWSDRMDVALSDVDPQRIAMREAQLAVLNETRRQMEAKNID